MGTIASRLAQKLKEYDWSEGELSRRSAVPQPTINRILSGESQSPRRPNVEKLARALGVSPEWLLFGVESGDNFEQGPDVRGQLPLISWVQAGAWSEVIDLYAVGDAEMWLPCPAAHGPRAFALRVKGESMYNPHGRRSFRPDDLIFVDPDRNPENGSLVVAKLDDSQEATFKQLVIEDGKRYLKALNPAWPEPMIPINGNCTIVGVVFSKVELL